MDYEDMDCGIEVRLPDGRTGRVVSYQANFGMSLDPNSDDLMTSVPENRLDAKVEVDGEEVEVKQHKLEKVE